MAMTFLVGLSEWGTVHLVFFLSLEYDVADLGHGPTLTIPECARRPSLASCHMVSRVSCSR